MNKIVPDTSKLNSLNKEKYHHFCQQEKDLPLFSHDWWLDTVCGEKNWDLALVERNGKIIATFPYYFRKQFNYKLIRMPLLTQTMGPYIKYPKHLKNENKMSFDKNITNELIGKLPDFGLFVQHFHYSITNWLPFYWHGFKQSTRYTYILEDLSDLNSVYSNFSHAKKKNIRKAEKIVSVKYDLPAKDFYANHEMTLKKQKEKIIYDFHLFEKLYSICYHKNCGKTIYASDQSGNIHSALFIIWNDYSAYNLISTIDPDHRNSGSTSLLIWEMIKYISDKTKRFDFEGSMIEGVERSFRQFGAKQIPYFLIYKDKRNVLQKGLTYLSNRLK